MSTRTTSAKTGDRQLEAWKGEFGDPGQAFVGERDVALMFENYCNTGNNLYIDRISVFGDCYDLDPPVANFISDLQNVCAPAVIKFTDLSENYPYSWTWTFEGGSPSTSNEQHPEVIYSTPGIYSVTLQVENEEGIDILIKDQYISIEDVPLTTFSYTRDSLTLTFTNLSQNGITYSWDFGDGNTSTETSPVHTYDNDGEYEVTLTATNQCGSSNFSQTVEVFNLPLAGLTQGDTEGCATFNVQFVNGSSANTTSLQWLFEGGDPATSDQTNPIVEYTERGVYDVTLIATNNVGADTLYLSDHIEILDVPIAEYEVNVANQTVNFLNNSEYADEYLWYFGDGDTSVLESPTHLYATAGNYNTILLATNDCGTDTFSLDISVGGLPSAGIDLSVDEICIPEEVQFFNASSGTPTAYLWIFEGGDPATSTDPDPVVTYHQAGFYDVTLIAINTWGADTLYLPDLITAVGEPVADFNSSINGFTVTFDNTSMNSDDYIWHFGDGQMSTEDDPVHNYTTAGLYDVVLISTNICGEDTATLTIGVGDVPLANFGLSDNELCLPATVQYQNLSGGDQNTYFWTFEGGDPMTSAESEPIVTYSQSGIFDVSLIVNNPLGSDTLLMIDFVSVIAEPQADFEAINDEDIIYLENLSSAATSYKWFVDDILVSTQEMDTITGLAIGFHDITLVADGFCGSDTSTTTIEILGSSVNDLNSAINFSIIPNPNNGNFTVEFKQEVEGMITLVDLTGKEVFNYPIPEPARRIWLTQSRLSSGVYLLKLASKEGVAVRRVIVQ